MNLLLRQGYHSWSDMEPHRCAQPKPTSQSLPVGEDRKLKILRSTPRSVRGLQFLRSFFPLFLNRREMVPSFKDGGSDPNWRLSLYISKRGPFNSAQKVGSNSFGEPSAAGALLFCMLSTALVGSFRDILLSSFPLNSFAFLFTLDRRLAFLF